MTFLVITYAAVAVKAVIDLIVRVTGMSNATVKQVVAWVLGVASTFLAAFANAPGTHHLGVFATTVLGLLAGTVANLVHDTLEAVNKTYNAPPGT